MPFPATRKPLHKVGAAGGDGSGAPPRSDAGVCCSVRSRESARPATGDLILFKVRCRHVLGLSEDVLAPSAIEAPSGPDSRQCSLSPHRHGATLPWGKASGSEAFISASIQPRTQSRRARMEACKKNVYSQSVFSTTQRPRSGGDEPVGFMEETKRHALPSMRHYLRRSV